MPKRVSPLIEYVLAAWCEAVRAAKDAGASPQQRENALLAAEHLRAAHVALTGEQPSVGADSPVYSTAPSGS